MTVIKSTLPETSILNAGCAKHDYVDSFMCVLIDRENTLSSTDIGKAFFTSSPKWVDKFFKLRNYLVSMIGLKTPGNMDRQAELRKFNCEPGERLGLFKVFSKTEEEIILGEDDKHLNFRVSLFMQHDEQDAQKKHLTVSTTVKYNNLFGRLYFLPVKPFHKFIVPSMMKGMVKELEQCKNY
jgi:hypothetical protein